MQKSKQKIIDYIKKEMKEPVITEYLPPIPDLYHFSAYEKAWLVEDPLIPQDFYLYKNGEVKSSLDISEIEYQPAGREDALRAGMWLLEQTWKYLDIKENIITDTGSDYTINVRADYYQMHPYFGKKPKKDTFFTINCLKGKWSIVSPENL